MFSQNNHALPPGCGLGDYRIERQISAGGFSIVKLFFEEGRALTGLDHPNVVRVLNFFRANDTVYLVMRFETGHTLRDHIRQHRGRLSEAFLRKMFSGVLDGLGEVHGCGLLHLDIKPANIWLRDDGSPVLLDFGAARYAVDIGPPAPRAMYTPGYAAPEQYHGKFTLGPWTDIYAVGACMYAALAGSAPQAADERNVDDELLPARQRWGTEYSPRLLATIDDCLRLDPPRRPQHARQAPAPGRRDDPAGTRRRRGLHPRGAPTPAQRPALAIDQRAAPGNSDAAR